MTTLAARILEAIEAAEVLAKAASPGPWHANPEHDEVLAVDGITVCDGFALGSRQLRATVDHIVSNDPDAVLRRCVADRKTVEQWAKDANPWEGVPDDDLHSVAQHPAYEYATTRGQRKAWDDENVPPEGDGWERNTDRGRDGWERYDYTEESYWRRPRPEGPRVASVPYWIANLAEAYGVPLKQEET